MVSEQLGKVSLMHGSCGFDCDLASFLAHFLSWKELLVRLITRLLLLLGNQKKKVLKLAQTFKPIYMHAHSWAQKK